MSPRNRHNVPGSSGGSQQTTLSILLAISAFTATIVAAVYILSTSRRDTPRGATTRGGIGGGGGAAGGITGASSSASPIKAATAAIPDTADTDTTEGAAGGAASEGGGVSVAFVGNSIIYFNDTPRFLQYISGGRITRQDSCLRGGASLTQVYEKGNGMSVKFGTENALLTGGMEATPGSSSSELKGGVVVDGGAGKTTADGGADRAVAVAATSASSEVQQQTAPQKKYYDIGSPTVQSLLSQPWTFLVMNDYTQAPARLASRSATIETLQKHYVPLLQSSGAIPIFIQTAAYRNPTKGSNDLGSVEEFTASLREGYGLYAKALSEELPPEQTARVSPVGNAYELVYKENRDLWNKLYQPDDFHPSPYGSYLQGCCLHWTMFDTAPNKDFVTANPQTLWDEAKCRVMQPANQDPQPRPTGEEAKYLWNVAGRVCGGRDTTDGGRGESGEKKKRKVEVKDPQ